MTVNTLQPSLRYRIQGAWELESYSAIPVDQTGPPITRRTFYPMTKHVKGLIVYSQDGYFSSQMSIPGQSKFPLDDQLGWAESAKRYYAYTGAFYVTKENKENPAEETLRHVLDLCLSPNDIGKVMLRTWKIEMEDEDLGSGKRRILVLGTAVPVVRKGRLCHLELKWRKKKDNSHGVPPEETLGAEPA